MGSDESHFNVSVGSDGQSQDSVHKPQPFWRERRAEAVSNRSPPAYQPNALPLGQTGSQGRRPGTGAFYCRAGLFTPPGTQWWRQKLTQKDRSVASGEECSKSSFTECMCTSMKVFCSVRYFQTEYSKGRRREYKLTHSRAIHGPTYTYM